MYNVMIEVGYSKILIISKEMLLPEDIYGLEEKTIESKAKYFVNPKENIRVSLVREEDLIPPDSREEEQSYKFLYNAKCKEADNYLNRAWSAEKKVKDFTEALEREERKTTNQ